MDEREIAEIIDRVQSRLATADAARPGASMLAAAEVAQAAEVELGDGIHATVDDAVAARNVAYRPFAVIETEASRELAGLVGLESRHRVHVLLDDRAGVLRRHLLDVHPALGRGHDHRSARGPVDEDGELDGAGTAEIADRVHGGPCGAARVHHVVDEDHGGAVDRHRRVAEFDLRGPVRRLLPGVGRHGFSPA